MLVKGQNSYVDMEEANAYFVDRLDAEAWTEASDTEKEQALITATALLDEFEWIGQVVDPLQPLAFPRVGQFYDKRLGMPAGMSPTPKQVFVACFELALHLLNNGGILNSSGSVKDISVGSVSISNIVGTSRVPSVVKNRFLPMLVNSGAQLWWRAN